MPTPDQGLPWLCANLRDDQVCVVGSDGPLHIATLKQQADPPVQAGDVVFPRGTTKDQLDDLYEAYDDGLEEWP